MRRQIYTLILILGVMLLFPLSGTAATKGIRIVPRSAWVKNDSLHLSILMDLEDVNPPAFAECPVIAIAYASSIEIAT